MCVFFPFAHGVQLYESEACAFARQNVSFSQRSTCWANVERTHQHATFGIKTSSWPSNQLSSTSHNGHSMGCAHLLNTSHRVWWIFQSYPIWNAMENSILLRKVKKKMHYAYERNWICVGISFYSSRMLAAMWWFLCVHFLLFVLLTFVTNVTVNRMAAFH